MTRCTFCNRPDRDEYERKIASKELTMSKAAQLMNSNKATVSRHMNKCVPARIRETMKPEPINVEGLNVVNALTTSHAKTMEILNDSLADGDRKTALLALNTEIKQLELNAKLTGQLNESPRVNILMHPEFVKLKQIMIKTLEPFPDARLKLSEALTDIAEIATDERE